MKKLLFILAVALFGCSEGYKNNKASEINEVDFQATLEFTYNGHDYIWFQKRPAGYAGYGGCVHNPDCKLCKFKNQVINYDLSDE